MKLKPVFVILVVVSSLASVFWAPLHAATMKARVNPVYTDSVPEAEKVSSLELMLFGAGEPLSASVSGKTEALFEVPVDEAGKVVTVTCRTQGYVCPLMRVNLNGATDLPVLPADLVKARLSGANDLRGEEFQVEAWTLADQGKRLHFMPEMSEGEDGFVSFQLPRGKVDLRVSAPEHVPSYHWGVEVSAGADPLEVALKRGASVVGFLRDGDSGGPIKGASVVIAPMGAVLVSDEKRDQIRSHQSESVTSGFFQIAELPAGQVMLTINATGYAPRNLGPITIEEGGEVVLSEIDLARLRSIPVEVRPGLGPAHTPWRVRLKSATGPLTPIEVSLDDFGMATVDGVTSSAFEVTLLSGGDTYLATTVDLAAEPGIFLDLELIPVEGLLTLGGDPISGRVFLSTGEMDRVEALADDEGRFSAWLGGPVDERLLIVDVLAKRSEGGSIRRSLLLPAPKVSSDGVLRLDVDLPDRWLSGTVFRSDGHPAEGAFVEVFHETDFSFLPLIFRTDATGYFATGGLAEGRYYIEIMFEDHEFASLEGVEASKKKGGDGLAMNLVAGRPIDGVLSDAYGRSVSGAWVSSRSHGPRLFLSGGETSSDGAFRSYVHPEASWISLVVNAPQSGFWTTCVPVPDEEGQAISLEMPRGARGVLRIVDSDSAWDRSHPPSYRLRIRSDLGGSFGIRELIQWGVFTGGPDTRLSPAGEEPYIEAGGIVAGRYAVQEYSVGPGVPDCGGAVPTAGGWSVLPEGGITELEMDIPSFRDSGGYRRIPPMDP